MVNRLESNIVELNDAETYRELNNQLIELEEGDEKQALLERKSIIENKYNRYSYFNKFSLNSKSIVSKRNELRQTINDIENENNKYKRDNYLKISPKVVSISMDNVRSSNIDSITRRIFSY